MTAVKSITLILLWVVAAWRLPGAIRTPRQRALWVAFASIAAAMTLGVPGVMHAVDAFAGVHNLATLGKNLFGIVASAAILDFVTVIARPESVSGLRRVLVPASAITMTTLTVLFALTPRPEESDNFVETNMGSAPGTAYYIVCFGSLGLAMAVATRLFWGSGRHAGARWLRWGLRTLGAGSAFGLLYSLYRTILMLFGLSHTDVEASRADLVADILEYTSISLIILGSSIPAIGVRWRVLRDWRSLREIRPLWAVLTRAVPHVVLDIRSMRPGPRVRLHRAVIEIRDATLVLADYASPDLRERADAAVEQYDLTPEQRSALAEAVLLHAAVAAKLAGTSPAPAGNAQPSSQLPADFDFDVEVDRLRAISEAYHSPAVHALTASAASTTRTPATTASEDLSDLECRTRPTSDPQASGAGSIPVIRS
ncbi:MAB_1171c family putative transporter [Streptomyces sp. NPDC060020]|uniref:MAB_1171c family putative transporter n=1 Tax=Streptomyces sp. NPDC060020 TaxID=3347038 RepID=UPI00369315E9